MQSFILVAFLIGLTCQQSIDFQYTSIYPLRATAVLHGETKDQLTSQIFKIAGKVSLDQYEALGNVTVTVDISGLPLHSVETGLWRGLHIHTYGILNNTVDVKSACATTGPHYNPFNVTHGSDNSTVRHIGDLGNVLTFSNGTIRQVYNVSGLDMYGPFSIVGRSVVLHELMDDYGLAGTDLSLSAGSSGARIACGVIGWDKSVSGSVENGFLTSFLLNFNITRNESEPFNLWSGLEKFFSFEDVKSAVVIDEVVEDEDVDFDSDNSKQSAFLPNQELVVLFQDYLKNITQRTSYIFSSDRESTESNGSSADRERRKLMKFF